MANGLYTGIALSGETKADHSGEENIIDAEKGAAKQRLADQAKKDKERAATEKNVRDNLSITPKLKTQYYQRMHADKVVSEISKIVEAQSSGEGNVSVLANDALRKMKVYNNSLLQADGALQAKIDEADENVGLYATDNEQIYGGKKTPSFIHALNDPYSSTPEGFAELKEKYDGAEHVFQENTPEQIALGFPETLVGYNPQEMMSPQDYFNQYEGEEEAYQEDEWGDKQIIDGKWFRQYGRKIPEIGIEAMSTDAINDPRVMRWVEHQEYKKAQAVDPMLSGKDFRDKSNWQDEIPNYVEDKGATLARKWRKGQRLMNTTPAAPKTGREKKPRFTAIDRIQQVGGYRGGGKAATAKEFLVGTGAKSQIVNLPAGTVIVDSGGTPEDPTTTPTQADVMPWRVVRQGNNIFFDYKGTGKMKDSYYSIPESQGSYESFVSRSEQTPEDILNDIIELADGNNTIANLVKGWHGKLYGSASSGGSGGSTKKGGGKKKLAANEVVRLDKASGKNAIFDKNTKKFIRWE